MSLTDEQKRMRLSGIGGSEVGALVGMNTWMKPIDVYWSKVDGREVDMTHHIERGQFFEEPTAKWWAHRRNAQLLHGNTTRHPTLKHVLCTPDFIGLPANEEPLDLSIKVPGPRTYGAWGAAGTDEIPAYALVQIQYELAVLGMVRAEVAAPIDGDLRIYAVVPDAELQGMLLEAAERFWRDHIEPKRPPPPDASDSYSEWIRERFKPEVGTVIEADPEIERWMSAYRTADAALAKLEAAKKEARQHLELKLGAATELHGQGWRVSFRPTKGRPSIAWEEVCREAGVPKALVEKHTKRNPYRVFRFSEGKSDE